MHQANISVDAALYQSFEYSWQKCYLGALIETDKVKLAEKLEIARNVIRARILENSVGTYEQQAIVDALNAMKAMSP